MNKSQSLKSICESMNINEASNNGKSQWYVVGKDDKPVAGGFDGEADAQTQLGKYYNDGNYHIVYGWANPDDGKIVENPNNSDAK